MNLNKCDLQDYSETAIEFCRALLKSRKFKYRIKDWNVQRSAELLGYNGSLRVHYAAVLTLINKDREYKHAYASYFIKSLTGKKDLELISKAISLCPRLNAKRDCASVPFDLNKFLEAAEKRVASGQPIRYFGLENSKEIDYPRAFGLDFTLVKASIYNENNLSNSAKRVKESLSDEDFEMLKKLFEEGYFYTSDEFAKRNAELLIKREKMKINSVIDIPEFIKAYNIYKKLPPSKKIAFLKTNIAMSKELLNYNGDFRSDYTVISACVKSDDKTYLNLKLSDKDMQALKDCGFIDTLIGRFNKDEFLEVVSKIVEKYGDSVFAKDKETLNAYAYEFGYNEFRNFYNDVRKIVDIMLGKPFKKNTCLDMYSTLTADAEVLLMPIVNLFNSKMQKPFDIDKFISYLSNENYIRRLHGKYIPAKSVRLLVQDYGRDYQVDRTLVVYALGGYNSPDYVLGALTEDKRIIISNMLGKANVLDRLEEFFKAWKYFTEIPASERDYRDFSKYLSEEVLEYPYDFKDDYSYIINLYLSVTNQLKVADDIIKALKAHNIEPEEFLKMCILNKLKVEKQYKIKKITEQGQDDESKVLKLIQND